MTLKSGEKWGMGVGAVGTIGSVVAGIWATRQANQSKAKIEAMQTTLINLENDRPPIQDIYANITDTSGELRNEYANIGVAARSSEIQMEEVDINLANTLDTLRAMGGGAGAATKMALAAMKSKQSISANLEQQEVGNQKLRAQGEMQLQQSKMQEQQRLQNASVQGAQWMYTQQDARIMQQLNRQQALIDNERAQEQLYKTQAMSAFGQGAAALGQVGGGLVGGSGK